MNKTEISDKTHM